MKCALNAWAAGANKRSSRALESVLSDRNDNETEGQFFGPFLSSALRLRLHLDLCVMAVCQLGPKVLWCVLI